MDENKDKEKESKVETPATVNVSGREYSQEELSELVGLGITAKEYETKWNRPIGDFYPDYTQKSQKLAEFEKQENERSERELQAKAEEGSLSPEDEKHLVLENAKKYGLVTQDEFEKFQKEGINAKVTDILAAKDLISRIDILVNTASEEGKPKVSVDDLLAYMDDTGIKDPEIAYDIKFKKELADLKEKKIDSIKPEGIETQKGGEAGSKQPPPPNSITRDSLSQVIQERLAQGGGA